MRMLSRISFVLFAPILGAMLLSAAPVQADERDAIFNIPSQTLDSALIAFSEQADVQVVVASSATTGIRTRGVAGQLSPQAALTALLANSGLQFQPVGKKTFALAEATPAAAPPRESANKSDDGRSVDQPQQVIPKSTEAGQARQDEVVVTGSRLRRAEDEGPAPVITLTSEQIGQLGVTNMADVINYLPQQSFGFEQNTFASAKSVRLRGLGLGTTLVLIDGRRVVTSALQGSRNFFDLNTIPLSAVERVEVLTNSASAVYGADAVGGVINVVLKRHINRPTADLYVGSAKGGDEERRATFSLGKESPKYRAAITLDAYDQTLLSGAERDRYVNQDYTRFGGVDRRALFANPGNVSSLTSANLPGLSSRIAAVPEGSTGVGLTPASFAGTAGQRNLESLASFFTIVPDSTRYSAVASTEIRVNDSLDLFGDAFFVDSETTAQLTPPILAARTVPASNAFNPFGVAVATNYLLTGLGPSRDEYESRTWRWAAGLKGGIGKGTWDWEVSALGINEDTTGRTVNGVDTTRVNAALASSDPSLALNVFQDGPGGLQSLLQSLTATPLVNSYSSDALQGSAFVRGRLFASVAGDTQIIVGIEAREEKLHFESRPAIILSADRDSTSGFAEVRIPVFGETRRVRAIEKLAFTVAGRYDDYNDVGDTFNPQYGMEWYPHPRLLLRGSYGTSFRAPSLFELYQPTVASSTVILDPRRANAPSPIATLTGGNAELEPEEAESLTLGFVYRLGESDKTRISASYWSVHQHQRVQRLTNNLILINESYFPDRVVRAAPTPTDIAAGLPGALISVNSTSINFGAVDTSGIDLSMSSTVTTRFGDFAPTVAATWVEKYDAADFPDTPVVQRVGVGNVQGTIPAWRGTASLAWGRGGIGLTAIARYISAYDDVSTTNVRTGRKVDSQVLLDLQGSLDLKQIWLHRAAWPSGLSLRAGLINALNEEPPFSEVSALGLDPRQADVRQRFAYLSLSAAF